MISKRYNLINNLTGWAVFAVALVTYWLTLEPTASYWDCGEFIIQADKLERSEERRVGKEWGGRWGAGG